MEYWLLAVIIIIIAFFIYGNYFFKVNILTVTSEHIPKSFDGYEILHISDLHNTYYGRKNRRLSRKINTLHGDIICYTGDLVDEDSFHKTGFYDLLEGVDKSITSYYVFGNHEDSLENHEKIELLDKLKEKQIILLKNNHILIEKGEDCISLHGLDLPREYLCNTYREDGSLQLTTDEIYKRLGKLDSGYHILLAHNPLYGDSYFTAGFDLTLSGHVHGGMIRLPWIGGLLSPDRSFRPKYSKGIYKNQGKTLVVSPGIGGHKIRFANSPYLYKIILKRKPS